MGALPPPYATSPDPGEGVDTHSSFEPKSNTLASDDTRGRKLEGHSHGYLRPLSPSPSPSGRLSPVTHEIYQSMTGGMRIDKGQSRLLLFWQRNKAALLVAVSQFFGALMNLSARLLELEGDAMHPVQILLYRQSLTASLCLIYMWWAKVPTAPFGVPEVRPLLVLRGVSGFFGIWGIWFPMLYIPLAEATVISFLAPGVAGIISYFVLREPYTRLEQLATLVAFIGVVLITQPAALFAFGDQPDASSSPGEQPEQPAEGLPGADHETTAMERIIAVGVALLGAVGGGIAFTCLRVIGKRADATISVNYFAVICTIICTGILVVAPALNISQPELRWSTPSSFTQYLLLALSSASGFTMQWLLTAGLSADKSNKANAMIYTHMLFAVSFDRWIFGTRMGAFSFAGCALIVSSAVGMVFARKPATPKVMLDDVDVERQVNPHGAAEASPMLVATRDEQGLEMEALPR